MTYRELLAQLLQMRGTELDDTVTVWLPGVDEFYPVKKTDVATKRDELDEGHIYLTVE